MSEKKTHAEFQDSIAAALVGLHSVVTDVQQVQNQPPHVKYAPHLLVLLIAIAPQFMMWSVRADRVEQSMKQINDRLDACEAADHSAWIAEHDGRVNAWWTAQHALNETQKEGRQRMWERLAEHKHGE